MKKGEGFAVMKKCMVVMALVMLFVMQAAFAEEGEFSIRGGIKWGMTRDEVIAIEAGSYFDEHFAAKEADGSMNRDQFVKAVTENGHAAFGNGASIIDPDSGEGLTLLTVDGAKVSKYEASIFFVFCGDRLNACLYSMEECDPEYMLSALESKYGEFTDDGHDAFIEMMRYIRGERQAESLSERIEGKHKLLEDGTFIHSIVIDGDYAILYQNRNGEWAEEGYDTSGL